VAHKRSSQEELQDIHGPMNSVSKEDAEEWTNRKHSHETEEQQHRIKVAKKQKAKNSSKKQDRSISKNIIKNIL
jgi:hypothetical protein